MGLAFSRRASNGRQGRYAAGGSSVAPEGRGGNSGLRSATAWTPLVQAPQVDIMQRFPTGTVYEAHPEGDVVDVDTWLQGKPVELSSIFAGRRIILLGLPGAFTPNCSTVHVPGYVAMEREFKEAGVDEVVALCSNDVFVTAAWTAALGATGKVRIMCDPACAVAAAAGLAMDARPTLGRVLYKRFCALVEDGQVRLLFVEEDGLGVACSQAVPLLNEVRSKKYLRF
jgi:peroxiredoxin